MQRCTERISEPGQRRRHRRNRAGVCLDCGDISHRAGRSASQPAGWVCPNCRSPIEWIEQIVEQRKREPKAGDNFICAECRAVSVVTADDRLRPMTDAEFQARRSESQRIIREAQARR